MTCHSIIVDTIHGRFPITPRWRGQFVAVHKDIVGNDGDGPIFSSQAKRWQITHIASGKTMGCWWRLGGCTLETVLRLAMLWDDAAGEIRLDAPQKWKRIEKWIQACNVARESGTVMSPQGKVGS